MVVNPLSHPFTPPATMLGGGGEWEEEEVMVRSVSGTYASSNGDLLRFLTAMLSTMKRPFAPGLPSSGRSGTRGGKYAKSGHSVK